MVSRRIPGSSFDPAITGELPEEPEDALIIFSAVDPDG
jgi:hypothetical protein